MKSIAIILLLSLPLQLLGQQNYRDSLNNVLKRSAARDSARVKTLLLLARFEFGTDQEKMVSLTKEAIDIASEIGYDEALAKAYVYLGLHAKNSGDLEKTVDYAIKSLAINKKLGDDDGVSRAYSMLGLVHQEMGDFEKAKSYLEDAMKINLANDNKFELSNSFNNLGVLHGMMGNNEEALRYFDKKLKLAREIGDTTGMAESYTNMAHASQQMNAPNDAIRYFERALKLMKIKQTSDEFATGTHDNDRLAAIYLGLAEAFLSGGNTTRALAVTDTALTLALSSGSKRRISGAYSKMADIQKSLHNYQRALEYNELHHRYNDSIFSESKTQQIADIESKYELTKKEQTIALLEKDNKIKALSRNFLVAGISVVVLIAAFLIYVQRQRNLRSRQLLLQQEQLNARLVETDLIKSRFFANISHEFRTPLTLILTPVEDKLTSPNLQEKDKITFQSIHRSANRLLTLVNQLLEQSKLEAGFLKLDTSPGKLSTLVMPVLSAFDSLADVGKVNFLKDIRLSNATVLYDADKLEKILNNLLGNAFKFTPPHGCVRVRVTSVESKDAAVATFVVQNEGAIIPDDQLPKLFDPFFQGENSFNRFQYGSGLGLAIVKEFVKLHGGEISVTSREGEGTIFKVILTFSKTLLTEVEIELLPQTTLSIHQAEDPTPAMDETRQTILVVEDNQEMRALIREGLESHYNVLEAVTGKEGFAVARDKQVDLVISDVMMPVMSGIELCHLLKTSEITSHLPVVLLTARADHESKLEGLRTGADDYVAKPFNMHELLARVHNLILQRAKLIEKYHNHIVVQPHEITVTPLDERFIQHVIAIVEKNLDNPSFDVAKLTEEAGISRTNLHRKLKAITGMSASEFVQDFRLKRAAILMEKKADTITQIAFRVGFNDQSYFTKCFRKKFGKTPSEYLDKESEMVGIENAGVD